MADNVTANAGSGGAVFATDDIGGVHYPRQKLVYGADGSATDVSLTNPLPIINNGPAAGSHFRASTAELTLALTVGQQRILQLWHPAANTRNVYISKVTLNFKATHTAGVGIYRMAFVTAESATGTLLNIAPANRAATFHASPVTARAAPTAQTFEGTVRHLVGYTKALAAVTGEPLGAMVPLYTGERDKHERITLRAGQAEGILIYLDVTSALTGAPILVCEIEWEEV